MESGVDLREPPGLHRRAMELAAQLRQDAAYDAYYLALAELLDCELWTADQRFYRAATPLHSRIVVGKFPGVSMPVRLRSASRPPGALQGQD